jgi:hypothetical protein
MRGLPIAMMIAWAVVIVPATECSKTADVLTVSLFWEEGWDVRIIEIEVCGSSYPSAPYKLTWVNEPTVKRIDIRRTSYPASSATISLMIKRIHTQRRGTIDLFCPYIVSTIL